MPDANSHTPAPANEIGEQSSVDRDRASALLEQIRPLIDLHDYYAAAALASLTGETRSVVATIEDRLHATRVADDCAQAATLIADAMLRHRTKGIDAFTVNEELLATVRQYRDDLRFGVSEDAKARRLEWIDQVLAQAEACR